MGIMETVRTSAILDEATRRRYRELTSSPLIDDEETAPDGRVRRGTIARIVEGSPIGALFTMSDVQRVTITRANGHVREFWRVCEVCRAPMDRHDAAEHARRLSERA